MTTSYLERVISFDSIRISKPTILENGIRGDITITSGGSAKTFRLIYTYSEPVAVDERIAGLILTMPV
ncbi:MAG: metal-binding protein, partial [Candidatus Thermoplasmatota archaeon]|nr:metal-binding protein [Candidatus Thermoplasmatota archaeon]